MLFRRYALGATLLFAIATGLGAKDKPGDHKSKPNRMVGGFSFYRFGDIDPRAWERFTPEQQKANIAAQKTFVQSAIDSAHASLKLYESPHFLIYADDDRRALTYGNALEGGYRSLVTFLNITNGSAKDGKQGQDVWRGKAMVFLFRDDGIAQTLLPVLHPQGVSGGSVVLNGNGTVEINLNFVGMIESERTAVFAMTEGFLYRYHNPTPLPTWIDNGFSASLADASAPPDKILYRPDAPAQPPADKVAVDYLKSHDLSQVIDGSADSDYKVAVVNRSLGIYMLRRNRSGYTALIKAIKDGMTTDEALTKKYGTSLDQLKKDYLGYLSRVH